MTAHVYDVAIVGGGPAGLAAALVLARACRKVVLFDAGRPRNAVSLAAHNFITREGVPPAEMRRLARAEVEALGVSMVDAEVDVRGDAEGFELVHARSHVRAGKLVLATGLRDLYPPIPGLEGLLGRGVHTCPYCDGWELRDRPLAVLGHHDAAEIALGLLTWSPEVALCTHGAPGPSRRVAARLRRNGVRLLPTPIAALLGKTRLEAIRFTDGTTTPCAGLFVHAGQVAGSDLAERLGCVMGPHGTVGVRRDGRSSLPGVYVAGDVAGEKQMILVAAASGAAVGAAINTELRRERCL